MPARRAVDQHDVAAPSGHHHGLGHAAQDGFEFVALLGQHLEFARDGVGHFEQAMLREAHRVGALVMQMGGRTALLERRGGLLHALRAS